MTARRLLFGNGFSLPVEPWTHFSVGFDRLFDELAHIEHRVSDQNNYPPHNLKRLSADEYELELAVAGFTEDDLEVEVEKHLLTVRGAVKKTDDKDDYLYRGVGLRSFTKTVALAETVVVRGATLEHGMLRIRLENVIPEVDKPRKISIAAQVAKAISTATKSVE